LTIDRAVWVLKLFPIPCDGYQDLRAAAAPSATALTGDMDGLEVGGGVSSLAVWSGWGRRSGDYPVKLGRCAVPRDVLVILFLFILLLFLLLGDIFIIEEDGIPTLKRVPVEHVRKVIGGMNRGATRL
jgi:hypothetical protein